MYLSNAKELIANIIENAKILNKIKLQEKNEAEIKLSNSRDNLYFISNEILKNKLLLCLTLIEEKINYKTKSNSEQIRNKISELEFEEMSEELMIDLYIKLLEKLEEEITESNIANQKGTYLLTGIDNVDKKVNKDASSRDYLDSIEVKENTEIYLYLNKYMNKYYKEKEYYKK